MNRGNSASMRQFFLRYLLRKSRNVTSCSAQDSSWALTHDVKAGGREIRWSSLCQRSNAGKCRLDPGRRTGFLCKIYSFKNLCGFKLGETDSVSWIVPLAPKKSICPDSKVSSVPDERVSRTGPLSVLSSAVVDFLSSAADISQNKTLTIAIPVNNVNIGTDILLFAWSIAW